MDNKVIGIVCLALALIAFIVAYDRYKVNAGNVELMNKLNQGMSHFGVDTKLKPAVPTITKVLVVVGVLLTAGGGYLIYQSKH